MIPTIKQAIGHEAGCATERTAVEVLNCVRALPRECNCSRREMIAWLERLKSPTQKMRVAVRLAQRRGEGFWVTYEAMMEAAEENT